MSRSMPIINRLKAFADWKLLLFLILFLNVKLVIKIAAILLIYLWQFIGKEDIKNTSLPVFYPLIIGVGLLGYVVNGVYTNLNYNVVFIISVGFWLMCILAAYQIKLAVQRNTVQVLHQTIWLFFIINTVVSLVNYGLIAFETHALNPYTYQGQFQKYFINTGDFIKGISFDTSTTNAVLNAFGLIYFLTRKHMAMALMCMVILLLTGSNFINVFTLAVLACLFVLNSNREQKSVIVVCVCLLVTFMAKVSPQNNDYVLNTVKSAIYGHQIVSPWPQNNTIPLRLRADSTLNFEERREKIATLYLDSLAALPVNQAPKNYIPKGIPASETGKIYRPQPNLHAPSFQWRTTTPHQQQQLVAFVNQHSHDLPLSASAVVSTTPGKITGFKQTFYYLKQHPHKILTGAGAGNFSSKLAFRATGLKFAGGYPERLVYINGDFLRNHLDVYLGFFTRSAATHSLTNSPFSVYDQVLAEYGLLGLLALLTGYLGYFARYYKVLTYGLPLIILVAGLLIIDYWFEQLSILVFFELLLYLNIKEGKTLNTVMK